MKVSVNKHGNKHKCKQCKKWSDRFHSRLCSECVRTCLDCKKSLKYVRGHYRIRRVCKSCINKLRQKYREINRKKLRNIHKKWWHTKRLQVKLEVFKIYGNKCRCCGVRGHQFLTIDHKNGRAPNERKRYGQLLYYYLRRKNYPKKNYQLLCWNCNLARGQFGRCPHKEKIKR